MIELAGSQGDEFENCDNSNCYSTNWFSQTSAFLELKRMREKGSDIVAKIGIYE